MKEILYSLKHTAKDMASCGYNLQWYLFGSILTQPGVPKDIDILVIYDSEYSPNAVRKSLAELSLLAPLHLLFMTNDEEREFNFIESQNAKNFYPI